MNGNTENSKNDDGGQSKLTMKFADNFLVDGHIEYRILVRDSKKNESWTITSRYSELRKVHVKLRELFPNNLPNFPQKKILGNMEPSFISQRQKALEIYFSLILQSQAWANSKPLKELLLNKTTHTKSVVSNTKEESKTAKNTDSSSKETTPSKSHETPKTEKPSPYHVALEKNLEQISNKFFDLQLNLNPPDDEEVKKRGHNYQKINDFDGVKTSHEYFKLPTGKSEHVIEAHSATNPHHKELQKLLKDTLHNIKHSMNSQPYLGQLDIISQFK